jgi:hypothetical protein
MRIIKVKARAVGTIPLAEVSGLAHGSGPGGSPVLIAIGDRAGAAAWAPTELATTDEQDLFRVASADWATGR